MFDLKPSKKSERKKYYELAKGSVFTNDENMLISIMHLAVSRSKDPEIINRPKEVLSIASEYAWAGLSKVERLLRDSGGETPLDHFCDIIEERIN